MRWRNSGAADPAATQRLVNLGYETIAESPDEFAVAIRTEVTVARSLASGETKVK